MAATERLGIQRCVCGHTWLESRGDVQGPLPEEQLRNVEEAMAGIRGDLVPGQMVRGQLSLGAMAEELDRHGELQTTAWPCTVRPPGVPERCPISGRPFFMMIPLPEDEGGKLVATYGGPYDSYTTPERIEDTTELLCRRYDHDEGGWSDFTSWGEQLISDSVLGDLREAAEDRGDDEMPSFISLTGEEGKKIFVRASAVTLVHETERGTAVETAEDTVTVSEPAGAVVALLERRGS